MKILFQNLFSEFDFQNTFILLYQDLTKATPPSLSFQHHHLVDKLSSEKYTTTSFKSCCWNAHIVPWKLLSLLLLNGQRQDCCFEKLMGAESNGLQLEITRFFLSCDIFNLLIQEKSIFEVLNKYLDCKFIF